MEWCGLVGCWCEDAEEITDGELGCDYDCDGCEHCEVVTEDMTEKMKHGYRFFRW